MKPKTICTYCLIALLLVCTAVLFAPNSGNRLYAEAERLATIEARHQSVGRLLSGTLDEYTMAWENAGNINERSIAYIPSDQTPPELRKLLQNNRFALLAPHLAQATYQTERWQTPSGQPFHLIAAKARDDFWVRYAKAREVRPPLWRIIAYMDELRRQGYP